MPTMTAQLTDDEIRANQGLSAEFADKVRTRDWTGVAAMYTEDGLLMPPNQPAVQGPSAIQAWMEQFPSLSAFELEVGAVDGRADMAVVTGTYRMTFTLPGSSASFDDVGKFLEVRRKESGGRWRIALDMFNSNKPAAQ
jgi:ketosteroid isomerase-like protein